MKGVDSRVLTSTSFSILVNRCVKCRIKASRGLRHDNSLFPLLSSSLLMC